ncbi:hypothetical protein ES708_21607 [subsurface metagenome]
MGATYVSRAVVLHLLEAPDRFCRDADGRADDARAEDGVGYARGAVVLQHGAVAGGGRVG